VRLSQMATYFAKASVTISPYLIGHVRRLYEVSAHAPEPDNPVEQAATAPAGQLRRTELAIPAYILSTAAVEAFVNEVFLSDFSRMVFNPSPLDSDSALLHVTESLERLDIPTKLILVPRLVIGCSLDPSRNPYQDMVLLARLRNELVHYKMDSKPPTPVKVLSQRGVAFRGSPEEEAGGPHPWAERGKHAAGNPLGLQHCLWCRGRTP
jgi:hypothetical protein